MAEKRANLLYPFDTIRGELLDYDQGYRNHIQRTLDEMRFTGTLTYLKYSRGRSAATLLFTDGVNVPYGHVENLFPPTPREFPFFMSTADEIIPLLVNGKITGTFIPVKRGRNYSWSLEKQA